MTPDIKGLVERLRGFAARHYNAERVQMASDAADALEAMAGEVEGKQRQIESLTRMRTLLFDGLKKRTREADAAIAERDRLAGEVESLKQAVQAEIDEQARMDLHHTHALADLAAERDRLKAALDIAKDHAKQNQRARDLVSPYPSNPAKRIVWEKALYHEGKDLWDKLRKALGGDA